MSSTLFESGNDIDFVASCPLGLEKALKYELKSLGAASLQVERGCVKGSVERSLIGKLNVCSRIAHTIMLPIARVKVESEKAFVDWVHDRAHTWICEREEIRFEADAIAHKDAPINARSLNFVFSDALRDSLVKAKRPRPTRSKFQPQYRFLVVWSRDGVEVLLSSSGRPLHMRGFRRGVKVNAPMRESVAAGLLSMGNASARFAFHDPFCGSGTIAIEQTLKALNIFPGASRKFDAEYWPGDAWGLKQGFGEAKAEAKAKVLSSLESEIRLSDWHDNAIEAATQCIENAGLRKYIEAKRLDARKSILDDDSQTIVSNLPFGERLATNRLQLDGLYRTFGERLQQTKWHRVLIFSAHPKTDTLMGLGKPEKRWPIPSGKIRSFLYRWSR